MALGKAICGAEEDPIARGGFRGREELLGEVDGAVRLGMGLGKEGAEAGEELEGEERLDGLR